MKKIYFIIVIPALLWVTFIIATQIIYISKAQRWLSILDTSSYVVSRDLSKSYSEYIKIVVLQQEIDTTIPPTRYKQLHLHLAFATSQYRFALLAYSQNRIDIGNMYMRNAIDVLDSIRQL